MLTALLIHLRNVQECILMVIISRPYIKNIDSHCLDFFILGVVMLSVIVDYMVRYGCYDVLSKQLLYVYIYHILVIHCILWLFCVCFLLTPCHRTVDTSCNRYWSL